ncbi:MAG: NFACT family protein [Erysipelotrichaceae bacterium]
MAVDGLILHQEIKNIKNNLPAKINKITQPSDSEIIFHLRVNRKNKQLLICAHSQYNRIHFTKLNYTNPSTPSGFLMLLRKNLENGIISSVQQGGLDRYLKLIIHKNNEFNDAQDFYLYVELMGKYANIILVNSNNKIIDALKRIPPFENNKRPIFSGVTFLPNYKAERKNPLLDFNIDNSLSLIEQYDGFSPLLAKEFSYRMAQGIKFSNIITELENSNTLYYYPTENTYHLIKLTFYEHQNFLSFTIDDGFDYIYKNILEELRKKQLTGKLFRTINSEIKKLNKKIPKLQLALEEAINSDKYRIYGDLIFANLNSLTPGIKEVTLFNYENNTNIKIKLDPLLPIKVQANKFYQKYKKGQTGKKHIQEQITKTENDLIFFQALQEQLTMATPQEALEIKEQMINKGYLKNDQKRKIKPVKVNYHQLNFKGFSIYYGTNSFQNDYVSFKLAHKNYLWFHAKNYHGAHVVANSSSLDEETLRFCANIAAYYSQGRFASSVEVQYTLVKNLKKIPNRPLGLVSISSYKTIYIDPIKPSL